MSNNDLEFESMPKARRIAEACFIVSAGLGFGGALAVPGLILIVIAVLGVVGFPLYWLGAKDIVLPLLYAIDWLFSGVKLLFKYGLIGAASAFAIASALTVSLFLIDEYRYGGIKGLLLLSFEAVKDLFGPAARGQWGRAMTFILGSLALSVAASAFLTVLVWIVLSLWRLIG